MRHNWLKVVLINLLVLAMMLVPLEIATRMFAPEYVNVFFSNDVTRGHAIVRNEKWGHRVGRAQRDSTLERTGDEYRALFIGDSITFGYGIEYEDAYHEVASQILTGAGCNVFVHGIGAYFTNLDKMLASPWRRFILSDFGPNLVIYQFNVNDLDLSSSHGEAPRQDRFVDDLQRLRIAWLNRSAFLTAVQSWAMRIYQRTLSQTLTDSLYYAPDRDPETYRRQWEVMEASLVAFRELFREHGAGFAVLLVPEAYRISGHPPDNEFEVDISGITEWPGQKMRALAGRLDIPVIETVSALQQYRAAHPTERLYFPNDENHPNQLGHRIIGEAAARGLATMIPGCSVST